MYDWHMIYVLQYMCLNMLCIECAAVCFHQRLPLIYVSSCWAAITESCCSPVCHHMFLSSWLSVKNFFKKARKNGWKGVAGIEWTIHCMKIRMAPAQGWHAQIEKCRYQVLLFIAWREWKDKGGLSTCPIHVLCWILADQRSWNRPFL